MRSTTILGILIGTAALFFAFFLDGGNISTLVIWPAIIIVVAGTIAATIAGTSLSRFGQIPKLISRAISPSFSDEVITRRHIYKLAEIFHKVGPLEMEKYIERQKANEIHPYLKRLTLAVVDGSEEEDLKRLAEFENDRFEEERSEEAELFKKMGGFAPTMGIIGTVMGLIATMASAGGSPEDMIRHIATAFIATLWGIFLANIVFLPIADKLDTVQSEEMKVRQSITHGMLSIARGDSPIKVRTLMGGRDLATSVKN